MKNNKRLLFLLALSIVLSILISGFSYALLESQKSNSPTLENCNINRLGYTREDIRKKLRKKYEFDYKPYLKGKKKLGFKPSNSLYRKVYYFISLRYVEPVNNKILLKGVFHEVAKLLKQAKVNPAKLKNIPRNGTPLDQVVNTYGDEVDPNLLKFACIRGLLEALNDPHSVLMLPDDYSRLIESMKGGNFSGIGVYIMQDPDNYNMLTVSEPIEGTPAAKAGLKPGDVITAVNGEPTKGEPIDVSVSKIRGPKGTPVVLTIKRKGASKPFKVSIRRAFIHVSSVKAQMINKNIGYLKLRVYGNKSGQELENAMAALEKKGAKAFILDLRNNSGGLINSSVDICSKFLPKGTPIVSVISRSGRQKVYRSNGGTHKNLPMVCMINELSASASEITAGALKDNARATLIGVKSFGKGSVQELLPIRANSKPAALKLTIALFYTPNGKKINKAGLEPDIKVPMDLRNSVSTNPNKDIQLKKAVKYLKTKI